MKKNLLWILVSGSLAAAGCELSRKKTYNNEELVPEKYQLSYDFDRPDKKYFLSEELEEISGLSWFGEDQLACVQDESGRVFMYHPDTDKVTKRIKFGRGGDYEGVEWVGDSLYVVRSDGTLLRFASDEEDPEVLSTQLPVSGETDVEGLGYDPVSRNLLLALKTQHDSLDRLLTDKLIYAYHPARGKWLPEPFITIRQEALEAFVKENKSGKKKEKVVFKPSGIAVHPITGEMYVVASEGKKLMVLNRKGGILAIVNLSPRMLRQPEGICFSPDGDLYLSSEGRGEDGFVLRFDYPEEKLQKKPGKKAKGGK